MATVDMLERLRMIQDSFASSTSLEATVASERIERVVNRTEQLIRQRAFLRDERRRLRLSSEKLSRQKSDLQEMSKPGWFPAGLVADDPGDKHLFLNVGGMVYECRASILGRDEGSLLAQLLSPVSPIQPDDEGVFNFDREWWLFRYIMSFLRDGTLPEDRQLLAQLYKEANFWQLRQLQRAIEEEKLNLIAGQRAEGSGSDQLASMSAEERQRWWRQNSNSFASRQEQAAVKSAPPPPPDDWWTGTNYRGRSYGPLSSDPSKVVTEPNAPDANSMLGVTWSRQEEAGRDTMNYSTRSSRAATPSISLYQPLPRPQYY